MENNLEDDNSISKVQISKRLLHRLELKNVPTGVALGRGESSEQSDWFGCMVFPSGSQPLQKRPGNTRSPLPAPPLYGPAPSHPPSWPCPCISSGPCRPDRALLLRPGPALMAPPPAYPALTDPAPSHSTRTPCSRLLRPGPALPLLPPRPP